MREFMKRSLALLLALILSLSLLPTLTLPASAASVNYVTGYDSEYGTIIKNWGTRGTVATFLSPNAEAFYEDNNVTYEYLSSLSGASSTSAVPSSALYQKLPKKKSSIYVALLVAMVVGRLVWGAAQFVCMGLDPAAFGFAAFWAGAITTAIPGIIVQIILIPILVMLLDKNKGSELE